MRLDGDLTRVRHILDVAREAISTQGNSWEEFEGYRPLQHAVVRCIDIIDEAASRLSAELRLANPDIPWQDIIGMRNRVIQAYYDIDIAIVWKTVTEDLPELLPAVEAIARGLKQPE